MRAQSDSSLSLQGKVALITGSGKTRGIGAGIATTLAQHGASVVINYVSSSTASSAAAVAEDLVAAGGKVLVVQADISRPEEAQRLVGETVTAFGKIDILGELCLSAYRDLMAYSRLAVNNAGAGFPGPALTATPESMATTFGVNVFGPLYLIQAAVAHMPPCSRVINIGSVASKLGVSGSPIYLASKAATDALTLAMAGEVS